jgi:hypothetical protein
MAEAEFFRWAGDDLLLTVRAQPKAAKAGIAGLHGAALKVRLTAPPAEGKANQALTRLLAGELDCAPSDITVERGAKGKDKTVRVTNADPTAFEQARQRWGL